MKKITLILLVLIYFANVNIASAQTKILNDSTEYEYIPDTTQYAVFKHKQKLNSIRLYIGVMPGFQIFKPDSAIITIGTPIGFSYRHYFKEIKYNFIDLDISSMPIVLNENQYTTYFKFAAGVGYFLPNYCVKLHFLYAHSFLKFNDMIGVGYDLEAQSIPLSVEYLTNVNNSIYLFLIGIKIPISTLHF